MIPSISAFFSSNTSFMNPSSSFFNSISPCNCCNSSSFSFNFNMPISNSCFLCATSISRSLAKTAFSINCCRFSVNCLLTSSIKLPLFPNSCCLCSSSAFSSMMVCCFLSSSEVFICSLIFSCSISSCFLFNSFSLDSRSLSL